MEQFEFKWQDNAQMNRITPKWIAKLVIWSVIVAYLPNIIWYFTGYPMDAVLMQFIVITLGMPPVVFFSMRAYRKYYRNIPLSGRLWSDGNEIVVIKESLSESLHRYIEVWKTSTASVENIMFNKDSGQLAIEATFHVEAYARKRDGTRGTLVATDWVLKTQGMKVPAETRELAASFFKACYDEVTKIVDKGDMQDEQET